MRISSAAGFAPHVGQSRQFCTALNDAPTHDSILTLGFILCFNVVKEGSIHISQKIGFILSSFAHSTTQKPTSMPALPHPPLPFFETKKHFDKRFVILRIFRYVCEIVVMTQLRTTRVSKLGCGFSSNYEKLFCSGPPSYIHRKPRTQNPG